LPGHWGGGLGPLGPLVYASENRKRQKREERREKRVRRKKRGNENKGKKEGKGETKVGRSPDKCFLKVGADGSSLRVLIASSAFDEL